MLDVLRAASRRGWRQFGQGNALPKGTHTQSCISNAAMQGKSTSAHLDELHIIGQRGVHSQVLHGRRIAAIDGHRLAIIAMLSGGRPGGGVSHSSATAAATAVARLPAFLNNSKVARRCTPSSGAQHAILVPGCACEAHLSKDQHRPQVACQLPKQSAGVDGFGHSRLVAGCTEQGAASGSNVGRSNVYRRLI